MANESPQVKLPGRMFRKKTRWWWHVQLPGEKAPRSRALKPPESRVATTDRRAAQEIALALWQDAIRAEAAARVKEREATKAQQLRAKLRESTKALTQLMDSTKAQAKAEATARAQLEAELKTLKRKVPKTAACHCCGGAVPQGALQRIDSGQRLCPTCLAAFRKEEQREEAKRRFLCPA